MIYVIYVHCMKIGRVVRVDDGNLTGMGTIPLRNPDRSHCCPTANRRQCRLDRCLMRQVKAWCTCSKETTGQSVTYYLASAGTCLPKDNHAFDISNIFSGSLTKNSNSYIDQLPWGECRFKLLTFGQRTWIMSITLQ